MSHLCLSSFLANATLRLIRARKLIGPSSIALRSHRPQGQHFAVLGRVCVRFRSGCATGQCIKDAEAASAWRLERGLRACLEPVRLWNSAVASASVPFPGFKSQVQPPISDTSVALAAAVLRPL
jgi:hypothetical protein